MPTVWARDYSNEPMNHKSTGFTETKTAILLGYCLLFLISAMPAKANPTGLPSAVSNLMQARGIPESSLSVVVKKVGSKQSTISHYPDTSRNPASAMKLVTTAAALQLLGPQHRWHTQALVHGQVQGNTLAGDLILKGGGDPWLVIERFWLLARHVTREISSPEIKNGCIYLLNDIPELKIAITSELVESFEVNQITDKKTNIGTKKYP